jgi:tetratricopeptide (TPR) repeat protein
MPVLTRRYGEAPGPAPIARAEHYLALAEVAAEELGAAGQREWLARLQGELDNVRAATGRRAAAAAGEPPWRFRELSGNPREGLAWLRHSPEVRPEVRAFALDAAGRLGWRRNDYETATAQCEAALALFRELGDRRGIARALDNLSAIAYQRGDLDRALGLCEESLALRSASGSDQTKPRPSRRAAPGSGISAYSIVMTLARPSPTGLV